jgi:hypothetical protein
MKKLLLLLIVCLVMGGFSGCNIETSDNGDLDGNWQLMEVHYFDNDSTANTKDSKIFLAFQFSLIRINGSINTKSDYDYIISRFEHTGDSLILNNFYYNSRAHDSLVTDTSTRDFVTIGVEGNEAHFYIEQLNSKTMILHSDFSRIRLRRF